MKRAASVLALLLPCLPLPLASASEQLRYNRDIRPILSENCFACHGFDANHRAADLRLDIREAAVEERDGVRAIAPGDPGKSELWRRITHRDRDEIMPPPSSHKALTAAQKEVLARWIREGAPYEPHWAYVPVKRSPIPAGALHPIDGFIDQRLRDEKIVASPPADGITQWRRAALDLTGLPPDPKDLAGLANPADDRAYLAWIEKLLASPHYGERMALHWLDVVRYASTVGFHGDQPFMSAPYRDYVIKSFNENKRFDAFTIEQIAGDLLPNPDEWQQVATCFNRLNPITAEGGAQAREYVLKGLANRVSTTSVAWIASSFGCAECHDHKFDPITAEDFYRMSAFWADVEDKGYYPGGNNSRDGWGKVMEAPFYTPTANERDPRKELETVRADMAAFETGFTFTASQTDHPRLMLEGWKPITSLITSNEQGVIYTMQPSGFLLGAGTPTGWVDLVLAEMRVEEPIHAVSLFVAPHDSLPSNGPGGAENGNFVLSEVRLGVQSPTDLRPLKIKTAEATHSQNSFPAAHVIDGKTAKDNGWAVLPHTGKPHQLVLRLEKPITLKKGESLRLELKHAWDNTHVLAHFMVATHTSQTAPLIPGALDAIPLLHLPASEWTEAMRTALKENALASSPQWKELKARETALQKECHDWAVLTTTRREPQTIRVLPRGNWMDDTGKEVTPGFPSFLAGAPPTSERLTRMDLARWIASTDNPLTARVYVNRMWAQLFGTGLCKSTGDFGLQGEYPSHPELLDWLAAEFMESGWDIKHMVRLIVTSNAYRRDSTPRPDLAERDPFNRLLARQSPLRLPAEIIRDQALAASGALVPKIGGPNVFPHQPAGVWRELNFPKRTYPQSKGESLFRRTIYSHVQRTFPHPMLTAFDAPDRTECTAERVNSNTPLQALALLNDPTFVEAAKALATRAMREETALNARLERAWHLTLLRKPDPAETAALKALYDTELARFRENPTSANALRDSGEQKPPADVDVAEWAAWTSVARALFNLHETITRL